MKYNSQRFTFAVLAGIVVNLAFTLLIKIACWGPLLSVILAAYLARVTTPRDGTVTGALIFIPASAVIILQTMMRTNTLDQIGLPLTIVAGMVGLLFGTSLGGLFGFLVGKVFEALKDNIFFT